MTFKEKALALHYDLGGKIEVVTRAPLETREELSLAYTPGVAEPCLEIAKDYSKSFQLTHRGKMVAVITNGTAVLGLAILALRLPCPSWRANVRCLKSSVMSTLSRYALIRMIPMKL